MPGERGNPGASAAWRSATQGGIGEADGPDGGPKFPHYDPNGVFGGRAFEWITQAAERDAEALAAVRRFVDEFGVMPSKDSWTAAGMSPCERTVRKRFGSFRAAMERLDS